MVVGIEGNPSLRENRRRDVFVRLKRGDLVILNDRDGGESGWLAGEEKDGKEQSQSAFGFHAAIIKQAFERERRIFVDSLSVSRKRYVGL